MSDIVGHHDPGFTLRKYAHTYLRDRETVIRQLGEYLDGTNESNGALADSGILPQMGESELRMMYTSLMTLTAAVDPEDKCTRKTLEQLAKVVSEARKKETARHSAGR